MAAWKGPTYYFQKTIYKIIQLLAFYERMCFTKRCAVQDGLTDSVRLILGNNNPQNRILLNLMLRAF